MRVVFMGSPDFATPSLRALIEHHDVALVVTQPDKPAGRGKKVHAPPVKLVAEAAGLRVIQPRSARKPELLAELAATGADVAVVVAYGKILPRAVLDAFPRGCINVHASLLPAYRGAAPIQWSIIRGETETGVCIMQLDEGMDTGPVLLERREPIRPDDTAGTLFERLAPLGAAALIDALAGLERGELTATPQDHSAASHAPMLSKTDGQVDWTRPAQDVVNLIRGVDPWPGAFTTLDGQRLKLFGARVCGGGGQAGELLGVDELGLRVACGRGACVIREVQAEGRKRMTASAFAAGRPIATGTVLGR